MGEYRDSEAAARHRARALEEELAQREREAVEHEREIERQRVELATQEAELLRLRAQLPQASVEPAGAHVCALCGKENQPHYKFCLGCGADLTGTAGTPRTAETTAKVGANDRLIWGIAIMLALIILIGAVVAVTIRW